MKIRDNLMEKNIWFFLAVFVFLCGCAATGVKQSERFPRASIVKDEQAIATQQDAYEDFKAAAELIIPVDMTLKYPIMEVLNKGWTKENKELEKLLSDNGPAFKEFQEGLEKKRFTLPAVNTIEERRKRLFIIGRWSELARLLNLGVQSQIYKNDYTGAVQSCFNIIRFGQMVEAGGNSLLKRIGMSIESNGYKNFRNMVFLQPKRMNYPHLLENIRFLQEGIDVKEHFGQILKKEFFDIKFGVSPLLLEDMAWQEFLESYLESGYVKEDVEQSVRVCYMDAIQYISLSYNEGLTKWILEREPQNPARQVFLPILKNMYIECGRLETERDATFIIIGLEYYYDKNKAYPAKLSELVPDYLPLLPNDPFSEEPFVYQRRGKGWIIYSIGSDLKDGFAQQNSYLSPDSSGDIIFFKE